MICRKGEQVKKNQNRKRKEKKCRNASGGYAHTFSRRRHLAFARLSSAAVTLVEDMGVRLRSQILPPKS